VILVLFMPSLTVITPCAQSPSCHQHGLAESEKQYAFSLEKLAGAVVYGETTLE
jgi:hypothetical protein